MPDAATTAVVTCVACLAEVEGSWSFESTCSPACAAAMAKIRVFQTMTESEFEQRQQDVWNNRMAAVLRDGKRAKRSFEDEQAKPDVDLALARLVDCETVLHRYGIAVRGRKALCPFHDERTPSMSLYTSKGKSRVHCHGCGWDGGVIDLEAGLSKRSSRDTIAEWGRR